jgi:hypothetical protein
MRHAQLRFFLAGMRIADPSDDEAGGLVAVRFFAADGALAGVAPSGHEGTRVGRRQVVLRERARGRSTTVTAEILRRLDPTPLALDRFEEHVCLSVVTRSSSFSGGSSTICHEPGPNRPALIVFPESGCGGVRTVIYGFVGDTVPAVRLRLAADGCEVSARGRSAIVRGRGGYSGRYAGLVRFLLVEAAARVDDRFRLLDSAGAVIGTLPVFDSEMLSAPPATVRLASGRGRRLSAARHRFGPCVYLTLQGEDEQCVFDVPDLDGAFAAVGCAPRVAVIAGVLSRPGRAVRAVLRGLQGVAEPELELRSP